jgi:hypothetical protein
LCHFSISKCVPHLLFLTIKTEISPKRHFTFDHHQFLAPSTQQPEPNGDAKRVVAHAAATNDERNEPTAPRVNIYGG